MDREKFSQGITFSAYLNKMSASRRDGFVANYELVKLEKEDLSVLARLTCPIYVVAFSEDWCGDCRINLPVLVKLAEASCCLEVRCFSLEEDRELANQLGVERIPTFIFYNKNFEEIGRWVERPAAVAQVLANTDGEEKRNARIAYNQGHFHEDTIDEILDILHA
ncbi:MAG TPA: thioredoxin family protein [Firmicutes bacterium]|jgi:thiol-disulfide isomerase/thioredoxin|nr:thioredoxin family protein [Bacillota bacterium]